MSNLLALSVPSPIHWISFSSYVIWKCMCALIFRYGGADCSACAYFGLTEENGIWAKMCDADCSSAHNNGYTFFPTDCACKVNACHAIVPFVLRARIYLPLNGFWLCVQHVWLVPNLFEANNYTFRFLSLSFFTIFGFFFVNQTRPFYPTQAKSCHIQYKRLLLSHNLWEMITIKPLCSTSFFHLHESYVKKMSPTKNISDCSNQ